MRLICIFIACSLLFGGCRFSIEAKDLSLRVSMDQTAYLSKDDPSFYVDPIVDDSDPAD